MPYDLLETIDHGDWNVAPAPHIQQQALYALESGKVVFFPKLSFSLQDHEKIFLSPDVCDAKAKNVSYYLHNDELRGTKHAGEHAAHLKALLKRYAEHSKQLLHNVFPHYKPHAKIARTSYRPVEIAGRRAPSYRKDDTLLHVDAFPSTPTKGERILRVFTNVNPHGKPRVWHVGETLPEVIDRFAGQVKQPIPGLAYLQHLLQITRDYRTLYDHYMLNIHHTMKGDHHYQKNVAKQEIKFPAGSTWCVYTDQVSHAALSGQYVFEQTFYVPVHGLFNENTAPLRILEKYLGKTLV